MTGDNHALFRGNRLEQRGDFSLKPCQFTGIAGSISLINSLARLISGYQPIANGKDIGTRSRNGLPGVGVSSRLVVMPVTMGMTTCGFERRDGAAGNHDLRLGGHGFDRPVHIGVKPQTIGDDQPGRIDGFHILRGCAIGMGIAARANNAGHGDALTTDVASFAKPGEPLKIVANLPYNIGTQLLVNWLTVPWPPFWTSLTLMFQKEVAERIVAGADDDHYGRLGVLCGWLTHAEMMFDLSPQAFTPPPKVTSTVVHIEPNLKPIPCDLAKLERITHAAFGQRRKMLRQSLKPLGGEALLTRAEIDPSRRAETLSVEEFCRIANLL